MNKILAYSLLGMLALGVGISCSDSFLDQTPIGAYPEASVKTKQGLEGKLINAYATLHGPAGSWYVTPINWVWGSIVSDEAYKGSEPSDQVDLNPINALAVLPSSPPVKAKWDAIYDGIGRANLVLFELKDPDMAAFFTEAERMNIEGQARFLRGFHHLEAVKVFKKAPYVDENVTDFKIPNTEPIWTDIEADLQFAYTNLPAVQDGVGRANKWAAATFLAKLYIFWASEDATKYAAARTVIEDIMANGVTSEGVKYGLVEKFADNFHVTTEKNGEAIFAIQSSVNDGSNTNGSYETTLNYPHNSGAPGAGCCGFFQPSQNLVNSFKTINGLPDFNNFNDQVLASDEAVPSTSPWQSGREYKKDEFVTRVDDAKPNIDRVYKALKESTTDEDPDDNPDAWQLVWVEEVWEAADDEAFDPRLDWTVGRRGIPYLDWGTHPGRNWIRKIDFGGPYSPKKHVYYKADKDAGLAGVAGWGWNNSAQNFTIARYADVLLWYAECLAVANELDSTAGAAKYVNMIRRRAANPAGFVKNPDGSDAAKYEIALYGGFGSIDEALLAIHFERKLELAMEGHRFFDLVRWKIAETVIDDYLQVERLRRPTLLGNADFKSPRNNYQPIPEYSINQSFVNGQPTLEQNDGY